VSLPSGHLKQTALLVCKYDKSHDLLNYQETPRALSLPYGKFFINDLLAGRSRLGIIDIEKDGDRRRSATRFVKQWRESSGQR
jgi:hypothetical protein